MNDNTKNFENTALTDAQTEQVSGGRRRPRSSKIELTDDQQPSRATAWPPMNPPHRNNYLTDDQLDQVSGGQEVSVLLHPDRRASDKNLGDDPQTSRATSQPPMNHPIRNKG